jgi:hypothetical protein
MFQKRLISVLYFCTNCVSLTHIRYHITSERLGNQVLMKENSLVITSHSYVTCSCLVKSRQSRGKVLVSRAVGRQSVEAA